VCSAITSYTAAITIAFPKLRRGSSALHTCFKRRGKGEGPATVETSHRHSSRPPSNKWLISDTCGGMEAMEAIFQTQI
jgi:hypothetical protein